jgi:hypothetical protein
MNVPPDLTNAVAVASGSEHILALRTDGTVVAWGANSDGQTNVPPGLTNVVAIAAGGDHSLALVGDGPPVLQRPVVNPAWDTNGFSVSVPTQNGRVYALEYKASPSGGNWTPLPLAAGAGGVLSLTDLTATNSQRFYRVRHR